MVKAILLGTIRMRGRALALVCFGLLGALFLGYLLGATRVGSVWRLGVRQTLPVDIYRSESSFSEIENTRADLQALLLEFLDDMHARHDAAPGRSGGSEMPANPVYAVAPEAAIRELQRGVEQFKGTEQELILTRELLWLLRRQRHTQEWFELYLKVLYEHPTCPLIDSCAQQAIAASEALGRESELADALDLLRRNPRAAASRVGASSGRPLPKGG